MNIKDIPDSWTKLRDWAEVYEKGAMHPNDDSHLLAETTLSISLQYIPPNLRWLQKSIFLTLLDDRLREAMKLPRPSIFIRILVWSFLQLRKHIVRNFFFPRKRERTNHTQEKNKHGRYNRTNATYEAMSHLNPLTTAMVPRTRLNHATPPKNK